MIVRKRPDFRETLFAMHGSILPRIAARLLFMLALSILAVLLARARPALLGGLSTMPFTLIGLSLSIFMSFRNSASYDRWWEGRKLWGQLVIATRAFTRQSATIPAEEREPMLLGLAAFTKGLAERLRDHPERPAIHAYLGHGAWEDAPNPVDTALSEVGRRCAALMAADRINPIHYSVLEIQLTELGHVQGGCERIKTTPLPFAYSLMLHRTAYLFCLLLPFALAPALGWWAPLLVLVVSYTFFGLDELSDQLADPFGEDPNDLPLNAIARMVERELLAACGRTDLPPPLLPENYVLH